MQMKGDRAELLCSSEIGDGASAQAVIDGSGCSAVHIDIVGGLVDGNLNDAVLRGFIEQLNKLSEILGSLAVNFFNHAEVHVFIAQSCRCGNDECERGEFAYTLLAKFRTAIVDFQELYGQGATGLRFERLHV